MAWAKMILSLVLPYLVDFFKYVYAQVTLKKVRQKRREEAIKRAQEYANAQTDQEIEQTFENRP